MVKAKHPRIVKKPLPPEADTWAQQGGLDPEIQAHQPKPADEPPSPKGKPYPHRVSFDMETSQYKRLKRAAFDEERTMNEVLREAIEDWLKSRNY
jgi:hypothetical protein